MDLKIDDVLERKKDGVAFLDMEYVLVDVSRFLSFLQK
jgi:Ras GTPase-activating-like protein IQGAP2/3